MQAVANNPSFAKKVGVPQSVGREFITKKGADMKKMNKGGSYRKVADGIAAKGKTKGKQVKMADGGLTGLARAAQMSGRTMPVTGRPAMTGLDRAAAMSGRTFRKGGMKGCK